MASLAVLRLPLAPAEPRRWPHRTALRSWQGTPGERVRVLCFTSCDDVELFLNGRSYGVRHRDDFEDRTPFWDLAYEAGELSVTGFRCSTAVATDVLHTAGPVVALVLTTDRQFLTADAHDLAHVVVSAVDADGVLNPEFDEPVHVVLRGPARLLALENGDLSNHEPGTSGHRHAHRGRVLAYVQAQRVAGPVTVTVTSAGVSPARLEVVVVT